MLILGLIQNLHLPKGRHYSLAYMEVKLSKFLGYSVELSLKVDVVEGKSVFY